MRMVCSASLVLLSMAHFYGLVGRSIDAIIQITENSAQHNWKASGLKVTL